MRRIIKTKNLVWTVAALVFLALFMGCGKKAAPLAPLIKGNTIAAPYDLKYKSSGDVLTLIWKYKADPENAKVIPSGFDVYMSKKTFEDCEGCPFKFNLLGSVEMPEMKYAVQIEKGYKYYFRIQAVNGKKMKSEYTKTVQYEYK